MSSPVLTRCNARCSALTRSNATQRAAVVEIDLYACKLYVSSLLYVTYKYL